MRFLSQVMVITAKDLRAEMRTKEAINASFAFALVILLILSFAFDPTEETTREIDEEVRSLLALSYIEAKDLLTAHRDELERVTAELIEHEAIDGQTFYKLIGRELPAIRNKESGVVAEELNLEEANQHGG